MMKNQLCEGQGWRINEVTTAEIRLLGVLKKISEIHADFGLTAKIIHVIVDG